MFFQKIFFWLELCYGICLAHTLMMAFKLFLSLSPFLYFRAYSPAYGAVVSGAHAKTVKHIITELCPRRFLVSTRPQSRITTIGLTVLTTSQHRGDVEEACGLASEWPASLINANVSPMEARPRTMHSAYAIPKPAYDVTIPKRSMPTMAPKKKAPFTMPNLQCCDS